MLKIIKKILGIKDISFLAVVFIPMILVGVFVVYPTYEDYVVKMKVEKQEQQLKRQIENKRGQSKRGQYPLMDMSVNSRKADVAR